MRQVISTVFFILLSISISAQEPIKVSVIVPNKAVAGQKFRVFVEMSNQTTSGFAKFTQSLPPGFTALEDADQDPQFSSRSKSVDLFWLRTPKQKSTTSYTIQLADTLHGQYRLEANFSYQYKNKSANIAIQSHTIEVQSLNQYLASGGRSEDLKNLVIIPLAKLKPSVLTKRTKSKIDTTKQELLVKLDIENQNHIQKAVLIENIPSELNVVVLSNGGAKVKHEANRLIFEWDKLPINKTAIAYKLTPKLNQSIVVAEINGSMNLENSDGTTELSVYEPAKSLIIFNTLIEKQNPQVLVSKENAPVEEKKPTNISTTAKKLSASASQLTLASKLGSSLKKGSSVSYKIQIAAFSKPVSNTYFNKLNLKNAINKEQHNGLYKYTIGEFKTYVEADAYKEHLLKTTKLESAFITAYKKTNRIEVSTALKKTKK
ncbi:MAG: hypothetical protein KAI79_08925 [Bacteroidales bacterium]|nr:hypothetical protein [Bacteroidales bacterium]